MVYRYLGQIVRRAWPLLLAGWLLLFFVTWYFAPAWNDVAQDKQFALLPADSPSRRAEEIFIRAFPEDHLASNIVLVLHREGSDSGRLDEDLKFIESVLEPGLRKIAE